MGEGVCLCIPPPPPCLNCAGLSGCAHISLPSALRTPLIRAVRIDPLPRHLTTSIGSSTYRWIWNIDFWCSAECWKLTSGLSILYSIYCIVYLQLLDFSKHVRDGAHLINKNSSVRLWSWILLVFFSFLIYNVWWKGFGKLCYNSWTLMCTGMSCTRGIKWNISL
jgi:hypothetical protein